MDGPVLNAFLLGAISVANLVAGMLFLRYWRSSRDRFFLYLVASFLLEAVNRAASALEPAGRGESAWHYAVRLVAYLLILLAIWEKNRARRP